MRGYVPVRMEYRVCDAMLPIQFAGARTAHLLVCSMPDQFRCLEEPVHHLRDGVVYPTQDGDNS